MVHSYHDGTKHQFNRFARSLGRLDWASQPNPFRSFEGAPIFRLHPAPRPGENIENIENVETDFPAVSYPRLFQSGSPASPIPLSAAALGDVLRHALGLSAWKQFHDSRWALRVNPSSGNLHPTEAYVVTGPIAGLADTAAVYHYAPDRHALEQRAAFAEDDAGGSRGCLIALTSIHWRESWKYGERAFRYCQHDLGHAIAAVRFAAALMGWSARMLPEWSHRDIASLVGIDRDEDFADAEREEPACVLVVSSSDAGDVDHRAAGVVAEHARLVDAVRRGQWFGRANQLSQHHVEWTFIDDVARATEDPGRAARPADTGRSKVAQDFSPARGVAPDTVTGAVQDFSPAVVAQDSGRSKDLHYNGDLDARTIILKRRSALAFDGQSAIGRSAFLAMLARTMPGDHAPWDAVWWTPRIHLVLFVHRVDGVDPGLYVLARDPRAVDRLKSAFNREFLWESADERLPLLCLARGDARHLAQRLSCDQEISADGFFSLGMIADFDRSLVEHGPSFYRHLFWESGVVGQVLYLEAEAAGARATGIGCFYDDPVHESLGLTGLEFQSLYHFTVGMPVDDTRLTTRPGYEWEPIKTS